MVSSFLVSLGCCVARHGHSHLGLIMKHRNYLNLEGDSLKAKVYRSILKDLRGIVQLLYCLVLLLVVAFAGSCFQCRKLVQFSCQTTTPSTSTSDGTVWSCPFHQSKTYELPECNPRLMSIGRSVDFRLLSGVCSTFRYFYLELLKVSIQLRRKWAESASLLPAPL